MRRKYLLFVLTGMIVLLALLSFLGYVRAWIHLVMSMCMPFSMIGFAAGAGIAWWVRGFFPQKPSWFTGRAGNKSSGPTIGR